MIFALTPGQTALADVADVCPPPGESEQDHFTDDETSPHEDNINCAASYDLVGGTTPTTFDPNGNITRGQEATVIVGFVETATGTTLTDDGQDDFPDDNNSVHEANIEKAVDNGLLAGFDDGTYRPNDTLTRAQKATIVVNAVEFVLGSALSDDGQDDFVDDNDSVHEGNIEKAVDNGILNGTSPTTYDPQSPMTRAQEVSLLIQAAGNVLHPADAWAPTAEAMAELVGATFNDNDESGDATSGDELVLDFNDPVATESTVTIEDADGDQLVLTDEGADPLADPEEVDATFEVSEDGLTVTITIDGDPTTEINGDITIVACTGIVDAETGEPVDCAGADVSATIPARTTNESFGVDEPLAIRTVDRDNGQGGAQDFVFDTGGEEVDVSLFPCENVGVNSITRFVDNDLDGEADDITETTTDNTEIVSVNGDPIGTDYADKDDFVQEDTTTVRINHTDGSEGDDAADCAVVTVFVDGTDDDDALEVDPFNEEPVEDFGSAVYVSHNGEAPSGSPSFNDDRIIYAEMDASGFFITHPDDDSTTGGFLFRWDGSDNLQYEDADVTEEQFGQAFNTLGFMGDHDADDVHDTFDSANLDLDRIHNEDNYTRTGTNRWDYDEDYARRPTDLGVTLDNGDATFDWMAPSPPNTIISHYTVTIFNRPTADEDDCSEYVANNYSVNAEETTADDSTMLEITDLTAGNFCAVVQTASQEQSPSIPSKPVPFSIAGDPPIIEHAELTTDTVTEEEVDTNDVWTLEFDQEMDGDTNASLELEDSDGDTFIVACQGHADYDGTVNRAGDGFTDAQCAWSTTTNPNDTLQITLEEGPEDRNASGDGDILYPVTVVGTDDLVDADEGLAVDLTNSTDVVIGEGQVEGN